MQPAESSPAPPQEQPAVQIQTPQVIINGVEEDPGEADADAAGEPELFANVEDRDLQTILGQLNEIWQDFLVLLPQIAAALVVLVVTALLARFVSWGARRAIGRLHTRRSLVDLVGQLAYIGFWVVGIMVAAVIIFPDLTPGRLIAGLGLTSIALGFAFKDIIENLIAGFIILWRYPVEIGDYIECDGINGKVEDINIRATHLRQVDGDLVIVPNSKLFLNPTNNLTNWRDRRITIICGIAYDEDVDEAREVIKRAVEACQTVRLKTHEVQIFAQGFGASSIDFEVTWWTGSTPLETRRSRDEVVAAVKRALDDAGIEIPFPYRTLTFKEPLPLLRGDRGDAGTDSAD